MRQSKSNYNADSRFNHSNVMAQAPLFGQSAVAMQENQTHNMTANKNVSQFALGMQDQNAGEGFVSKRNQYAVIQEKEDNRYPRKQEYRQNAQYNPPSEDMYRMAGE